MCVWERGGFVFPVKFNLYKFAFELKKQNKQQKKEIKFKKRKIRRTEIIKNEIYKDVQVSTKKKEKD